jgi:phosphomevalonate kinase
MKRLGDLSGTPIEPDEQTRLLDACLDKGRGVLGVGVPGGEFGPFLSFPF